MFQMTPEIYVDQSAAMLRHTIVAGKLDLNQFKILITDEIFSQTPKFTLTGRIIGASHLLSFEINGQQYHEIFACTGFVAEGDEIASYGPLGKISANMTLRLDSTTTYSFSSQTLDSETAAAWLAVFEEETKQLRKKGGTLSLGLHYDFPRDEITRQIPKTIVQARFRPEKNRMEIETAHSYSNEQKIVRSESILKFADGL